MCGDSGRRRAGLSRFCRRLGAEPPRPRDGHGREPDECHCFELTPSVTVRPPLETSPPAIVGTGEEARRSPPPMGLGTARPFEFAHQWQRCDAQGENCADIAGATAQLHGPRAMSGRRFGCGHRQRPRRRAERPLRALGRRPRDPRAAPALQAALAVRRRRGIAPLELEDQEPRAADDRDRRLRHRCRTA